MPVIRQKSFAKICAETLLMVSSRIMEKTITRKELGRRLRDARDNAGLKATPVAAEIGCHPDTIANYESGATEPSFRAVCVYSIMTGRPLDWFLGEKAVAA